jgi:hypothetical protein
MANAHPNKGNIHMTTWPRSVTSSSEVLSRVCSQAIIQNLNDCAAAEERESFVVGDELEIKCMVGI